MKLGGGDLPKNKREEKKTALTLTELQMWIPGGDEGGDLWNTLTQHKQSRQPVKTHSNYSLTQSACPVDTDMHTHAPSALQASISPPLYGGGRPARDGLKPRSN